MILIGVLLFMLYWFLIRPEIFDCKMRKIIHTEIINGNKNAIAMKQKFVSYRIENKDLMFEALKGNEHAIEALNLKSWMK